MGIISQFDEAIQSSTQWVTLPNELLTLFSFLGNIKLHLICVFTLIILFTYFKKSSAERLFPLFFSLCFLFFMTYLLKVSVARARPGISIDSFALLDLSTRLFDERFHSFPSSHAAIASFYLSYYRKNPLLYLLGFFLAYSRILLEKHFPSDVVAGCVVGLIGSYLGLSIYRKALLKIKKGKFSSNLP
jgi:undecaprenyl-diphosphatase